MVHCDKIDDIEHGGKNKSSDTWLLRRCRDVELGTFFGLHSLVSHFRFKTKMRRNMTSGWLPSCVQYHDIHLC